MITEKLLLQLEEEVENRFRDAHADHDFDHIKRVTRTALYIQSKDGGDKDVVHALALLHDISDHKLNGGAKNDGGRVGREVMEQLGFPPEFTERVAQLIDKVSFKGAKVEDEKDALELDIVRDADRLDAIGAIGIARAFHFGGARNRALYKEDTPPTEHESFDAYAADKSHTLNHFYEKLLLLKDRMQTNTARELAAERHQLMEEFVSSFLNEWEMKTLKAY